MMKTDFRSSLFSTVLWSGDIRHNCYSCEVHSIGHNIKPGMEY